MLGFWVAMRVILLREYGVPLWLLILRDLLKEAAAA